jgi:hypothetical protein
MLMKCKNHPNVAKLRVSLICLEDFWVGEILIGFLGKLVMGFLLTGF